MSDAIATQVLEANRRFYDALEALDIEGMEACWASGPEIACVHPGGAWEAIMANTGYIEFEIAEARVQVVDPVAWVTCVERITSAVEGETAAAEAAATNVFVLGSSGWRMALHHASPIIRDIQADGR